MLGDMSRRVPWTVGGAIAIAVALASLGCQRGILGLKIASIASSAATAATSSAPTPDLQGHLGPQSPGAPFLSSIQPPDAGAGAQVLLSGQNLGQRGLTVRFGALVATYSAQPDGSLLATVPTGAVDGQVGVFAASASQAVSSRPFQVIASLSMRLLDTLPGRIGYPLHLAISALDTAGSPIASPDVTLSVDPPGAAQVTGYGQVTPTEAGSFQIQAISGYQVQSALGAGCGRGFSLQPFAGDGTESLVVNGEYLLSENSTDAIPLGEPDPPLQEHLNDPIGMIPFTWQGKPGVLFSDSAAGLLRFVPYDGSSISVVVGGATGTNTDVPNGIPIGGGQIQGKDAQTIQLHDPSGLAIAPDPDYGGQMVVIADSGINEIVAWNPGNNLVRAIAGTGLPVVTDNSSNSVGTSPLGDGGGGRSAAFTDPTGVAAVAGQANTTIIYVADTRDHAIRRIEMPPGGEDGETVTTLIGSGAAGTTAGDPDGASDSVDTPYDVTVVPNIVGGVEENAEAILVADTDNDRVLEVTGDTNNTAPATISDHVLIGVGGSQNDDIQFPTGLAVSTQSPYVLAVASSLANDIQFFPLDVSAQTVTAQAPTDLSCSGQTNPQFGIIWPRDVELEQVGSPPGFSDTLLLFSDFTSDTIRRLTIN